MQVPKYKPQQWVIFTVNTMHYLGQITSAVYADFQGKTEWRYSVTMASGTTQPASEAAIQYYFDGDHYVEVTRDTTD
jgi:hypothetical protein